MAKEWEIISVEPFTDITPEGRFIKKYRIRVRFFGKFEDWIEVTDEEFVKKAYLDKIQQLLEVYKEIVG